MKHLKTTLGALLLLSAAVLAYGDDQPQDLFRTPDNAALLKKFEQVLPQTIPGIPIKNPLGQGDPKCRQEMTGNLTLSNIFDLCPEQLEKLYRSKTSDPGPIPNGNTTGKATFVPGSGISLADRAILRSLWTGKIFIHNADGSVSLINKTIFGEKFPAKVYVGGSKLDGGRSIIIDYTQTQTPFYLLPATLAIDPKGIRDEIRLVAPNLYLGYAYLKQASGEYKLFVYFALDSSNPVIPLPMALPGSAAPH